MVAMKVLKDHDEWLANRLKGLGGSEISAVLGLNPWLNNVELWELKTGRRVPQDLSNNELVQYGHDAEPHLRELFALDHPEYSVYYVENNSFINTAYPWAQASLDGWLTDSEGRKGILEIKTTSKRWDDNELPQNYFCQVLFYMAVYEAEFAEVKSQLKWKDDSGNIKAFTQHLHIERAEVQDDIDYLMSQGERFWKNVTDDIRPALILPEI